MIRHLMEAISQKGGFSGEEGRSNALPCHEVRVITTLLREERGSGGSAPIFCMISIFLLWMSTRVHSNAKLQIAEFEFGKMGLKIASREAEDSPWIMPYPD